MPQCITTRGGPGQPAVQYDMLHMNGSGYLEEWTPQTVNSTFYAMVDWPSTTNFVQAMLPIATQDANNRIQRLNPQAHPYFPFLYCVGLSLMTNYGAPTTVGVNDGTIHYVKAVYKCTFAGLPYFVRTDDDVQNDQQNGELIRYVERKWDITGEAIQTNGQFQYASDGVIIPTPPALMNSYTKLKYKWYYVPDPIINLCRTACLYYGTVNDTIFDIGFFGPELFTSGKLLYLGMELERIYVSPTSINGVPGIPPGRSNVLWNITHNFAYRPQGWNVAYRFSRTPGSNGSWDPIVTVPPGSPPGTPGNPPYASQPFLNLFQPSFAPP